MMHELTEINNGLYWTYIYMSHFKNLVIFFKSCHVIAKLDTLLGINGHIYIYILLGINGHIYIYIYIYI